MALPPVGSQLIVFGRKYDVQTDIERILDTLAAAGYAGVEGGPKDAVAYRRMLDERGLRHAGSHTSPSQLQDVKPLVEYLRATGASDISNSGLRQWNERTLQDYRATIEVLNEAGRRLRDQGIHLHYHNHDFEFEKVDGERTGMELLLDGLDPEACDLCVDVAWVQKGGGEPAAFLQKYKERIGYLHLKDFDDESWTELGRGQVKLDAVIQTMSDMPRVRWAVIEQDTTRNEPMDSVTESRRFLRDTFNY